MIRELKMIRKGLLICILLLVTSANAEFSSTATYSGLPFKNLNVVGASDCNVFFYDVYVSSELMKVMVDLDNVEVALSTSNPGNLITTLDLIDAKSDVLHDWLSAAKVVIQVRSAEDLSAWNKFFKKAKEEREKWRLHLRQPSRVLPPKN